MAAAAALAILAIVPAAAIEFPLNIAFDVRADVGIAAVASTVTIKVDRLMEESRWKRVTDALRYSGYGNFLNELRGIPAIGSIALPTRKVEVRYAREQTEPSGRRLLLVADRPLFFVAEDRDKPRAGYELTIVDLHFNSDGTVTGTMTGAARVKPSPDGPVVTDYAETPVQLNQPAGRR